MCTKNGSHCEKEKFRGGGGGQGRCEQRSEAFVKIQKKNYFFWGGGGVSGSRWGLGGGGGRRRVAGGVRVDVNREV